jgi:exodeoxyribonuclease VII large subunit
MELAQHGAFARMMELIRRRQQRVDDLQNRLLHSQRDVLELCRRRFETLAGAVRHYDARRILAGVAQELAAREAAMASAMRTALLQHRSRLEQLSAQIVALSPLAILERGYALVFDAAGKLLKDTAQVSPGDDISARLAHGSLTATVKKTTL